MSSSSESQRAGDPTNPHDPMNDPTFRLYEMHLRRVAAHLKEQYSPITLLRGEGGENGRALLDALGGKLSEHHSRQSVSKQLDNAICAAARL